MFLLFSVHECVKTNHPSCIFFDGIASRLDLRHVLGIFRSIFDLIMGRYYFLIFLILSLNLSVEKLAKGVFLHMSSVFFACRSRKCKASTKS